MHRLAWLASGALLCLPAFAAQVRADIVVEVSKSQQQLAVSVDGIERYRWPVSTGRRGLETPSGSFRPLRLERKWFSRQYDYTPMPWSIFFHGGYAVHGTGEARKLGRAVSHGCVRLEKDNALTLFTLVKEQGKDNVSIVVTDALLPVLPGAVPMAEAARLLPRARPVAAIAKASVMAASPAPAPETVEPAATIEIAVPMPAEIKPRFAELPKPAITPEPRPEAAAPPSAPIQAATMPVAPVEIAVPLPAEIKPQFAELPKPQSKPQAEPEAAVPDPAPAEQVAAIPAPPRRVFKPHVATHPPRIVHARAYERFTAVGDEAAVRRGREAWLRSLDRKYGMTR
jgi:hypothetical protein